MVFTVMFFQTWENPAECNLLMWDSVRFTVTGTVNELGQKLVWIVFTHWMFAYYAFDIFIFT